MNLVTRIILLFAAVSMLVFLAGGVISYRVMQREVDAEQERFLIERLDRWTEILGRRPLQDTLSRNQLVIIPLSQKTEERISFNDTLVMHSQLERLEPHLKLTAVRNVAEKSYLISLYGVVVESDDIVDAVTESLIKTYLILLAVILPIGGLASFYLLKPFKSTLHTIRDFSLQNPKAQVHFQKSSVSEFKKLNQFLEEMTSKVRRDYASLKEFSENASHELQTPIAIAQSKLEVLQDGENLTEEQINQIGQVQSALKRLSNLSTSLGLLTKINNQEFDRVEKINLSITLKNLIDEFSELISLKSIELKVELEDNVIIESDSTLLELMLSNMINNAIRHNHEKGFIDIQLTQVGITMVNSGQDVDINPNLLFERFRKPNQSSQSIGLGLAIVKQVCERNGFVIGYEQVNQKHRISVKF